MPARSKVLGFLFGLTLITYLDRVCISATATAMKAELGLDNAQMGDIFSAFVLGVVNSRAFQMARAENVTTTDNEKAGSR